MQAKILVKEFCSFLLLVLLFLYQALEYLVMFKRINLKMLLSSRRLVKFTIMLSILEYIYLNTVNSA